jgi:hypothetical protein
MLLVSSRSINYEMGRTHIEAMSPVTILFVASYEVAEMEYRRR